MFEGMKGIYIRNILHQQGCMNNGDLGTLTLIYQKMMIFPTFSSN